MSYHIQDLFIYPVKSLAGISMPSLEALPKGFKHDRRWMLIGPDDAMLTQRAHPRMALIQPAISDGNLVLTHRQQQLEPVSVPLSLGGSTLHTQVFDDPVEVQTLQSPANEWLSDALGTPARLVVQPEPSPRQADLRFAQEGEHVSLADGFPYLLISQESLDFLNTKLAQPVPMNRFRPNIVVRGCQRPHEEDSWQAFRADDIRFRVVKPCARCTITTVDQQQGVLSGAEPLKTLSTYRKAGNKTLFGMNLLVDQAGTLQVGSALYPELI